ncbi:MAG TPA: hypothetical protein PKD85_02325 [Saprospiraceae bacterium]|nr:hypothetical protein [Saprospiraceae bacterium]
MYLECPEDKGKFLAVNLQGELSCKELTDPSTDKIWNKIEPKHNLGDGFFLVSDNYRMSLDYKPDSHGEEIKGKTFSPSAKTHTLWNMTEDNEIYTIDKNDDKKYLWPMIDMVFVTPDENMAEKWTPVSLEGYDMSPEIKKIESGFHRYIWFFLFIVVLYIILF